MRLHPSFHKNQGFTMIELMIVVAIIAILSAIAIPQYEGIRLRAMQTEGTLLMNELAKKQIVHYGFYDQYATLADLGYNVAWTNMGGGGGGGGGGSYGVYGGFAVAKTGGGGGVGATGGTTTTGGGNTGDGRNGDARGIDIGSLEGVMNGGGGSGGSGIPVEEVIFSFKSGIDWYLYQFPPSGNYKTDIGAFSLFTSKSNFNPNNQTNLSVLYIGIDQLLQTFEISLGTLLGQ